MVKQIAPPSGNKIAGVNKAPPGRTTISTPTSPHTTASHWPLLTFSPNRADAMVTKSGEVNITAVASARGMYLRPVKNSNVIPTRLRPRASCMPGRWVCVMRRRMLGVNSPSIRTVCDT